LNTRQCLLLLVQDRCPLLFASLLTFFFCFPYFNPSLFYSLIFFPPFYCFVLRYFIPSFLCVSFFFVILLYLFFTVFCSSILLSAFTAFRFLTTVFLCYFHCLSICVLILLSYFCVCLGLHFYIIHPFIHSFIHFHPLSEFFLLYFSFFSRVACFFIPLLLFRSLLRFFPFYLLCHLFLCFSLLLNNYQLFCHMSFLVTFNFE